MDEMKKVETRDGSVTFFNEEFQEHYHSHTIGAIEEGVVKFAGPCDVKPGFKILDVCFGLGYNTLAALMKTRRLEVVGLENDIGIISRIKEVAVPHEYEERYSMLREMVDCFDGNKIEFSKDDFSIRILIGDALERVKDAGDGFDAVFLDPFSPKKCPQLWTKEFFDEIFKRMKSGGVLTTYSCATGVRKNLAAAGFEVKDGPIFGRKSPATVAVKP